MASKTESKVMGYSAAGVSLAALVGYLYFKGDKISDLTEDQLSKILDGIGAEITDAGSEMIKGNGSVVSSYSISTDPKDGGSESKPLLSIPNEKTPAQPYKYVINKGGDTEPQFQVVKDAEGNIIGYYKAPSAVGANDGEYFKVNPSDPEQAGTWYKEVSVNPTTGKITGKEVTSTGGLAEESTDLGSATVGTTNITSVAGVSGNVTVESLVSQETFRELKDSNGNVIGLFKEGTVGANDSRLYINGKWYNDLKINQDGTITDKAGKELGEIGSSEYELKINDVTYKGNVGAGVKYDAITTQGDFTKNPPVLPEVVGYMSSNSTYPQTMVMFDENGFSTNGIVSTRQNLTKIQEQLIENIDKAVQSTDENKQITEALGNELKTLFQGQDLTKYKTVESYVKGIKEQMNDLPLLNKLSLGTNELANGEAFDKINNYLSSNIADPGSLAIIGLSVGVIAAIGATACGLYKNTDGKHKIVGATSLSSRNGYGKSL